MSKPETRLAKRIPGSQAPTVQVLGLRSDADHIAAVINGEAGAELTPALQHKLKRLERVADLISSLGNSRVVANKICAMWPDECSMATAYRWIGEAQEVFTPQHAPDRAFWVENLMQKVLSTRAKAEAAQDLKTMAACEKNLATIIEKFMGTNESMPIDKLQPPRMLLGYYPELAGVALPIDLDARIAKILHRRQVGVVADHADFQEAEIVDDSATRGAAAASKASTTAAAKK